LLTSSLTTDKESVMPTPRFLRTKPLCGSLTASLILSLCAAPLTVHAMDFEEATVTKTESFQSQTSAPAQNAARAVTNTAHQATRQTAGVYDKVLEYQKSKRPLGNQIKSTFSPKKIPGITKAEGLGKSGAYERN